MEYNGNGKTSHTKINALITEFRVRPETSHADGMILFYRAASKVSYGYAGVRGCIRRALSNEYSEALQMNMTMCHSFAEKFSVDTKVLFEGCCSNNRSKLKDIDTKNQEYPKRERFYVKSN